MTDWKLQPGKEYFFTVPLCLCGKKTCSTMPIIYNHFAGVIIAAFIKNNAMKTSRSTNNKQNKQGQSKKPRPEIRDDMDSRERKEGRVKGEKNKNGSIKKS
jgi:hypothetical protein